jgi:hypothetical protein
MAPEYFIQSEINIPMKDSSTMAKFKEKVSYKAIRIYIFSKAPSIINPFQPMGY